MLQERKWSLLLTGVVVGALLLARPPGGVRADAPEGRFSSERAFAHVEEIARAPHPVGSKEHERVREYLVAELTALGLDPRVTRSGPLANVSVLLPGTGGSGGETGTLLLVAHYDTKPAAPGAGDNGAAVAAILETLRALGPGPNLENDLLVLFTDGEEIALLGARAFVASDPRARDVDFVLNFEARGSSGRSLLFQTSRPNRRLISAYRAAADRRETGRR